MNEATETAIVARRRRRFSYLFVLLVILSVSWLHMAPLMLTGLFSYLALNFLNVFKERGRWATVALFVVLLGALTYGSFHFFKVAVRAFPEIADKAIPAVIEAAKQREIELPFTDFESLRQAALDFAAGQADNFASFARFARGASTQVLYLIAGCVIAIGFFLTPRFHLDADTGAAADSLYAEWCGELGRRFEAFYRSFHTVIGAQIAISAINTTFTAVFVFGVHLPHALVVIVVTFLCGLLPVIGNLISNTVIVGIGFTISPQMAVFALVFLVLIHKLEYFLNSKIIGGRIRNPFWLTLLGLIVGERLMGIPGIILAPVILHYVRLEASQIPSSRSLEAGSERTRPETPADRGAAQAP